MPSRRSSGVVVEDPVVGRSMWPPHGSSWEPAVTACGHICYVDSETGDWQWAPPPGSYTRARGAWRQDTLAHGACTRIMGSTVGTGILRVPRLRCMLV